jgi:outer membrane protein assembly factor BamB
MVRWLIALALVAGMGASTCLAQEWTRFRGPNGSGAVEEDSIPAEWSEGDFNWKLELPGMGHSSPVVWGDRVFLMSADPNSATRYVLGIDAQAGKIAWKREYAASTHPLHTKSSYASTTPAVDEERVYAAWSDPEHTWLCAFTHDGVEQWKIDLGGWIGQHGFGSSPMIAGDLVILSSSQEPEKRAGGSSPTDCFIVGVDRRSGELKWRTPRAIDTASYSVPCLRKNDKGKEELVCLSTAEGIFGLEPQSGKQTWSSGKGTFSMRTVSSPVLWNDVVFGTTGSGAGGNYVVAYRPGDDKPLYEIKKEMPYVPTPIVYNDLVFLWSDGGIVTCIRAADGRQVWQQRIGGKYSGSPVRAGKKIFCTDEEGTVVVIAASDKFELLGRNKLGEKSHSTPAVAGGRMYVRTVSHLYSVGGKKS